MCFPANLQAARDDGDTYDIIYDIVRYFQYGIQYSILFVFYLKIFSSKTMTIDFEGITLCFGPSVEQITFPFDTAKCQ